MSMAVVRTFGGLLAALGVLFAQIAESERLAILRPVVWFVFVVSSVAISVATGSDIYPR